MKRENELSAHDKREIEKLKQLQNETEEERAERIVRNLKQTILEDGIKGWI